MTPAGLRQNMLHLPIVPSSDLTTEVYPILVYAPVQLRVINIRKLVTKIFHIMQKAALYLRES